MILLNVDIDGLRQMPSLQVLWVHYNVLSLLPNNLRHLNRLQEFDTTGNVALGAAAKLYDKKALVELLGWLAEFESGGSVIQDTVKVMLVGEGNHSYSFFSSTEFPIQDWLARHLL